MSGLARALKQTGEIEVGAGWGVCLEQKSPEGRFSGKT